MKKVSIPQYDDTVFTYFEADETNTAVKYPSLSEAVADFREQWSAHEGADEVWFWEIMTEPDNPDWPDWVIVIDDGLMVCYADDRDEDEDD